MRKHLIHHCRLSSLRPLHDTFLRASPLRPVCHRAHRTDPRQATHRATEAELPQFTCPVAGSAQQLLEAPTADFLKFAEPVRADIDRTLTAYQIEDHATVRHMVQARLGVNIIAGGHDKEALDLIQQIRALEDKPAEKLTSSLEEEVYVRARMATRANPPDVCPAAYEAYTGMHSSRFRGPQCLRQ